MTDGIAVVMAPFGEGLRAFHGGDHGAQLLVRRDDGLEVSLPVAHFFRFESGLYRLERLALESGRGRVLDIGAGTGIHSLILQSRGLDVCAKIMARRGVKSSLSAGAAFSSPGCT